MATSEQLQRDRIKKRAKAIGLNLEESRDAAERGSFYLRNQVFERIAGPFDTLERVEAYLVELEQKAQEKTD